MPGLRRRARPRATLQRLTDLFQQGRMLLVCRGSGCTTCGTPRRRSPSSPAAIRTSSRAAWARHHLHDARHLHPRPGRHAARGRRAGRGAAAAARRPRLSPSASAPVLLQVRADLPAVRLGPTAREGAEAIGTSASAEIRMSAGRGMADQHQRSGSARLLLRPRSSEHPQDQGAVDALRILRTVNQWERTDGAPPVRRSALPRRCRGPDGCHGLPVVERPDGPGTWTEPRAGTGPEVIEQVAAERSSRRDARRRHLPRGQPERAPTDARDGDAVKPSRGALPPAPLGGCSPPCDWYGSRGGARPATDERVPRPRRTPGRRGQSARPPWP